jgi:hypothetical protein
MFRFKNKLQNLEPGQEGSQQSTLESATSLDDIAELFVDVEGLDDVVVDEKENEVIDEQEEKEEENVTWGKALGLDDSAIVLDDEGNLKAVKVKVDGQEEEVALKELVSGYRFNKHNTQKSQALAEEEKQFKAIVEQTTKQYTDKVDSLEKATAYVKGQFLKQYEDVNWSLIRQQNPAEYAALVQDFQMQSAEFDRILEVVASTKNAEVEKLQKEFQESRKQLHQRQIELTLEKNPEWKDQKVLKSALEDMGSFAGEAYGFTPQEFASINDHRMVEVLKDAMKFRRGIKEAEQKIVQQKPNFQKQTSAKRNNVSHLDKLIKRAATSTGTQKRAAETDAIAQLLIDTGVKT